jgi:hypothetical protein
MPHCIHRRFCHQGDKALLLRMVNKLCDGKILPLSLLRLASGQRKTPMAQPPTGF